jgi:transcriptional regulator with XRE-family HTH domain
MAAISTLITVAPTGAEADKAAVPALPATLPEGYLGEMSGNGGYGRGREREKTAHRGACWWFAVASTRWHTEGMRNVNVNSIGEYIREQREQAKISMRQLAQSAGVSNPYLSQIERGLRKPSADILQQIAKGLRISAEALYVQAGILEDRPADSGVRSALLADPELSERQKQVLVEIYESFRRENAATAEEPAAPVAELTTGAPGSEGEALEAAMEAGAEAEAEAEARAEAQTVTQTRPDSSSD